MLPDDRYLLGAPERPGPLQVSHQAWIPKSRGPFKGDIGDIKGDMGTM